MPARIVGFVVKFGKIKSDRKTQIIVKRKVFLSAIAAIELFTSSIANFILNKQPLHPTL
ncbi:hypothetical protein [Microcoleus sp. F4-D5]|uniref:hypothetical protein n=1 Tax=Microcoleus sp. F4-D5 TaxID=2818760 RepID=UPI002FD22DAB